MQPILFWHSLCPNTLDLRRIDTGCLSMRFASRQIYKWSCFQPDGCLS